MDIYDFLQRNQINFQEFKHQAVFTVEESSKLPPMPGAGTKNLFLCDRAQTTYFLVTVPHEMRVDLRSLGRMLNAKDITFGSPEKLLEYLGVTPGSVTLLGLVNDQHQNVEFWIDESLWSAEFIQTHPLTNTSTLVMPHVDLERFLALTNHAPHVAPLPARAG